MKAFLPLLSILLALPLLHAQPLNPQDPASVAKHYLNACEKWDVDAAAQVLPRVEDQALRHMTTVDHGMDYEQAMMEMLCAPLTKHATYTMGEVVTTGDECRIKVTATYTIPQTLVLKKGPDGKWTVALEESIFSTTGAEEAMIVRVSAQAQQEECLNNLRQLCTAILQYAQDFDETLPDADNWMDQIRPYMRNEDLYKCPGSPELEYDYAFNTALSKKHLGEIANPGVTIIVFESNLGTRNAHGNPADVPNPGRHNGGNNVGYVDGHAKWLKAD
ncbi:MAG: H-X9-DG-CTERM domain-containing protein [Armatimonadia bacterium]